MEKLPAFMMAKLINNVTGSATIITMTCRHRPRKRYTTMTTKIADKTAESLTPLIAFFT